MFGVCRVKCAVACARSAVWPNSSVAACGFRSSLQSDTGHPPFWKYMAAGRQLFDLAKSRVFDAVDMHNSDGGGAQKGSKRARGGAENVTYRGKKLVQRLEVNSKWQLLRDVLAEIQETRAQVAESAQGGGSDPAGVLLGPTLVIVRDERSASQVISRGLRCTPPPSVTCVCVCACV